MPRAPATDCPTGARFHDAALLICSHGSRGAGRAVRARARSLERKNTFAETAGCLLYGDPKLEQALECLAAESVYLVPLFMAEGVTLGALEDRVDALAQDRRLVLCRPVGRHPDLPSRLVRAAEAQARTQGWPARETAVVLVGHGSWRSAASRLATEGLARALAEDGRFAEVAVALLENGPPLDSVIGNLKADRAVVIGCFAENGRHALEDLPGLLAGGRRPSVYLGPIGAAPWFDQLVLELALEQASADARPKPAEEALS